MISTVILKTPCGDLQIVLSGSFVMLNITGKIRPKMFSIGRIGFNKLMGVSEMIL